MKAKVLLSVAIMLGALSMKAQTTNKVGAGTRTPTEILDVNGTVRVRELPTTGQTSSIYTTPSGTASSTKNQTFTSKYTIVADENGVLGKQPLSGGSATPQFFYMPPIVLPLDRTNAAYNSGTGLFTIDLHARYTTQFGTPQAASVSGGLTVIPKTNLDFYVLYYDTSVFTNVSVSAAGVLTYATNSASPTVTEYTFMTIVFKPKN